MTIDIFEKYKDEILNIVVNGKIIVSEISAKSSVQNIDFSDKDTIEYLTEIFMKKLKKNDRNFLLWLYIIGSHIKKKYEGEWVVIHKFLLFKQFGPPIETFIPAIIDKNENFWNVGNLCYQDYYLKYRLRGISFHTFYMLHVERAIYKSQLSDNIRSLDEVIFIERN